MIQNTNMHISGQFSTDHTVAEGTTRSRRGRDVNKKSNTLFVGNSNLGKSKIDEVKKKAQKEAYKIISNAFTKQKEIDQRVTDNTDKISKLNHENQEYMSNMDKLDSDLNDLKESYGITDDSEEQQDLELLKKREDASSDKRIKLSADENAHLKEIDEKGLTEYQKAGLDNYKLSKNWQSKINENNTQIMMANEENKAIRLASLKSHPMVDAGKAADQALASANSEIKGMLVSDAKDHIDKEQKEQKKEALDKKKEDQETQDKIDAAKEKKEEQEAMIEKQKGKNQTNTGDPDLSLSDNSASVSMATNAQGQVTENISDYMIEAQKSVNQMKDRMKLLNDDLKGIEVDSQT